MLRARAAAGGCEAAWTARPAQMARPTKMLARFIEEVYRTQSIQLSGVTPVAGSIPAKSASEPETGLVEFLQYTHASSLIEWLRDRPDDATTRSTFAEEERMKRFVGVVAVLAAICLAAPAGAQVQTGSILVRATDQQGAMMPGVT